MEVEAARSFWIGLRTILRLRGHRDPEAMTGREIALAFCMASYDRDIGAESGGQAPPRARCR